MAETRFGWHFLPDDGKLTSYKGSERTTVEVGKTFTVGGEIIVCRNGLHGSTDPLVSLSNAPGAIVTWCEFSGPFSDDAGGKFAARSRTVLKMADATRTLHEFALWSARRALMRERKAGREPDKRSWDALTVKRRWLNGKATDAARAAAWDAAAATAADAAAAWDAAAATAADAATAWDAAWAAAADAATAWDAAAAAATAADAATAWDAAWAAERAIQRKRLTYMLNRLLED